MSALHTPGPWQWEQVPGAGVEVRGPYKDGTRLLFTDIWRAFPEPKWDAEMQANARLIAAAPELLAALRDVISWVPGASAWHTDAPIKAVESARAAIARATGVEP